MKSMRSFLIISIFLFAIALSLAAGEGRNMALCIGVDVAGGEHRAGDDAKAVGKAFEWTGGFRKVAILTESDADGKPSPARLLPTRKNVLDIVGLLGKAADPDAAMILFYAGSGNANGGRAKLVLADGEMELSELAAAMAGGKAVSRMILMDAAGLAGPVEVSGVFVITSHSAGEEPLLEDGSGRGLFSLALELGLADTGGRTDGAELVTRINKRLENYCLDNLLVDGQTAVATGEPVRAAPGRTASPTQADTTPAASAAVSAVDFPLLGITVKPLNEETRSAYSIDKWYEFGVVIAEIDPAGRAAKLTKMKVGWILDSIDGKDCRNILDFQNAIKNLPEKLAAEVQNIRQKEPHRSPAEIETKLVVVYWDSGRCLTMKNVFISGSELGVR